MYDETGYHPPDWSAVPKEAFNVEVLKDGLIIDTIYLADKAYYTLGRQHDIVDIPMDHPSISRIHAVLNYRSDGSLMLLDLNSAQGTYLNKSICEKNVYHRVYVGDIIKFGASTRKYIVNGPDEQRLPEYNSANLINLREKLQSRSQEIKRKLERDNECSWGFSEHSEEDYNVTSNTAHTDGDRDAGHDDDEEDSRRNRFRSGDKGLADLPEYLKNDENYDRKYGDKYAISINESSLKNEKDAAIHDKIRMKERKIQNMQEENRRIYMKETSQDGGLTEGQMNAVKRNDVNILQHKNDIDNLLKQLQIKEQDRNRKNSDGCITSNGKKRGGDEDDDDEEQLLDETSGNVDVETNFRLKKKLKRNQLRFHGNDSNGSRAVASSRALSYQDIDSEMINNDVKLSTINEQMNVLNRRIESLASTIGSDNDGSSAKYSSSSNSNQYRDASIDDIIVTNQIQEYKLKLTTLTAEKLELESKRQGLQRLLFIATPALKSLVQKSSSSTQQEEMVVKMKVESKDLVAGRSSNNNAIIDTNVYVSHDRSDSYHKDASSHVKIIDRVSKDGLSDAVSEDNITAITNHAEALNSKSLYHHDDDDDRHGSYSHIDKADSSSNSKSIDAVEGLADTLLSTTAAVVQGMLSVDTGRIVRDSRSSHGSSPVKGVHDHAGESVGGSSTVTVDPTRISHDDTVHVEQKMKSLTLPLRAKVMSAISNKVMSVKGVRNEDQLSFKSDVLEGGEYVWIPPKLQTGDGKTSLNAKYGY